MLQIGLPIPLGDADREREREGKRNSIFLVKAIQAFFGHFAAARLFIHCFLRNLRFIFRFTLFDLRNSELNCSIVGGAASGRSSCDSVSFISRSATVRRHSLVSPHRAERSQSIGTLQHSSRLICFFFLFIFVHD